MLCCVVFACQRLATAPADMHMTFTSWSWAEVVMERMTRGRVKKVQMLLQRNKKVQVLLQRNNKVQVLLQRRACCAVRCACRANALRALCV